MNNENVSNFSVVEFASLSDMKTAIEKLDDTELNGRRVRLVEDRRGGRSGTLYRFIELIISSYP